MHKLVITGNGFDLAHGLRTSYKDFLEYIWTELFNNPNNELVNQLIEYNHRNEFHHQLKECKSSNDVIARFKDLKLKLQYDSNLNFKYNDTSGDPQQIFQSKSLLFNQFNEAQNLGWADLEQIYYSLFKKISLSTIDKQSKKAKESIQILNSDFEVLTKLLEEYLSNSVDAIIKGNKLKHINDNSSSNSNEILKELKFKANNIDFLENYMKEFHVRYKTLIEEFSIESNNRKMLFLDFNYTSNTENYVKMINSSREYGYDAELIQIHGKLEDENNRVNFGFGDEMDEDYKMIENLNQNEYLRHIKSFRYLLNSNYRKMLSWIEENKFQVVILGHSCGLSDRTLLNTIFEHKNCLSIKVFYYKDEQNNTDNFSEIVNNISRHFNDKKLLREKIVSKDLCKPISQNYRY